MLFHQMSVCQMRPRVLTSATQGSAVLQAHLPIRLWSVGVRLLPEGTAHIHHTFFPLGTPQGGNVNRLGAHGFCWVRSGWRHMVQQGWACT